jgi:hypothetical protein
MHVVSETISLYVAALLLVTTCAQHQPPEDEMAAQMTRVRDKAGWPDAQIGKGALDDKEAKKYAEQSHLGISLISFNGDISIARTPDALVIAFPDDAAESYANVFKIE